MQIENKMQNNFSVDGYWWVPSEPKKQYGGVLEYNKDTHTELRLFGVIFDFLKGELPNTKLDVIHGMSTNGKEYTLLGNIIETYSISLKYFGGYSIIRVKYLLEGYHFNSYNDIFLKSITCNLSNLDNWLSIDSFNRQYNKEEESIKLNIKPKWEHKKYINCIKSKIELSYENRVQQEKKKLSFISIPLIQIEPADIQNLDWYLEKIHDFKNLFTIFVGEPTKTNFISTNIIYKNEKSIENSQSINIFLNDDTIANEIEIYKMLIPSYSLKENIDEILNKWFILNKQIRPMINTFLASYYNSKDYLETRLLNCTYAAEGIHKKMKNIDKSVGIEDTVKYIIADIDEQYYSIFIKNKKTFILDIIAQRNLLVHHKPPEKELSFNQFFLLTYRFQLFIRFKILNLIGISYDILFDNIKKYGLFSNLWKNTDES